MDYPTRISNYFRQRDRGWILSLIAFIAIIYLPFIGNAFFFDDTTFLDGTIEKVYTNSFLHFDLRWFPYITLKWTAHIFSDVVPHFFHVGNMLLHTANVLLLFFLLRQLKTLVLPLDHNQAFFNWGIWLGALLFACHPVAVYAVGYVIQRNILMATLFTLALQLAYIKALICEQKFAQRTWFALSVIFYFLAAFSKEHSVTALAVLATITILLYPNIRTNKKSLLVAWSGYLLIGIYVTLRAKGVFGVVYEFDAISLLSQQSIETGTENLHLLSVLTQTGLFFKYMYLWLLPNPAWISIDMRETFANSAYAWENWIGLISFLLYGICAFRLLLLRNKAGLIGFALLYPWLMFIVELSTIRVQEPFVLYRSYLWMPGVMLLIPLLIDLFPSKKTIATILVIILTLIPLSWNRLWIFADRYRIWDDAALLLNDTHTPGAVRIYFNRGKIELDAKHWEKAIADFKRVEAINPKIEQIYNHMGTAYIGLGRYREAVSEFDQAIAINPNYADAFFGKSIALRHMRSYKEASWHMEKSCMLGNGLACLIADFSKKKKIP